MDKIYELISDPAWWFSAILIAIIAGIIASFAKDGIAKLLSNVSSSLKVWLTKKEEEYEKDSDYLARNPTLAIIAHIQLAIVLILILLFSMAFLSTPVIARIFKYFPSEYDLGFSTHIYNFFDQHYAWLNSIFGLLVLPMLYKMNELAEVCYRTRKKLKNE